MKTVSIMPCLDIKDGRVVKGVRFVGLQDAGDPAECASIYSETGADELAFLDITATMEKRATTLEALRRVSAVANIPLTVGGGIASLGDVEAVLEAGASRVSISSAAYHNPMLIEEIATRYGSERVVVAIDVDINNDLPSGFEVYINGGNLATGKDAVSWARQVAAMGAGMILPTSKTRDGAKTGYDLPLIKSIKNAVEIPIIASGGAGKMEHFLEAVTVGQADVLLAASVFHFGEIQIKELKKYLYDHGVSVRL